MSYKSEQRESKKKRQKKRVSGRGAFLLAKLIGKRGRDKKKSGKSHAHRD